MTASGSLKKVRPGHHRQVNRETCDDMVLFHSFLEDLRPHNSFPNQVNRVNTSVEFYMDAAGTKDLGMGYVYKSHWAQGLWSLLELLAITMASEIWIEHVQRSVMTLKSGNEATCYWLTSIRSKIPAVMCYCSISHINACSFKSLSKQNIFLWWTTDKWT